MIPGQSFESLVSHLYRDGVQPAADHGLGVTRRSLDELHPRAEAEFGVDVGEVGLHGAR